MSANPEAFCEIHVPTGRFRYIGCCGHAKCQGLLFRISHGRSIFVADLFAKDPRHMGDRRRIRHADATRLTQLVVGALHQPDFTRGIGEPRGGRLKGFIGHGLRVILPLNVPWIKN